MAERMPIRKRGGRLPVARFLTYLDGAFHIVNTKKTLGIPPQEYQRILHERAAYVNQKYLTNVIVRSQCDGDIISFRVIGDLPPVIETN